MADTKDTKKEETTTSKISDVLEGIRDLIQSPSTRRAVFGEYTDGKPRSLVDALNGEYQSPEEKEKFYHKPRSKKKKASEEYLPTRKAKPKALREELLRDMYEDKEKKKKKKKKNKKKKDKDLLDVIIF